MNYSTNYNLNKPERNEQFNLDDWNNNTDAIDTAMNTNKTNIANNASNISTILTGLSTVNTSDTNSVYYKLMKLIYPVGSLYWSSKSTNPGTLFGGTWTQIKDRFVLACGDTYNTTGATGGASSVTLSVSNMPSHNHTFTPSGRITMNAHSHKLNNHTHSFSGNTSSGGKHKHGPSNNLYNNYQPDGGGDSANTTGYLSYFRNNPHWYTESGANNDTNVANENNSSVNTSTTSVSPNLTGYAGYHSHSFSGTTGGNSGNTTSTTSTGSFSGTQGTTSSNGSGTAFNILPPYVVKYCWERTA